MSDCQVLPLARWASRRGQARARERVTGLASDDDGDRRVGSAFHGTPDGSQVNIDPWTTLVADTPNMVAASALGLLSGGTCLTYFPEPTRGLPVRAGRAPSSVHTRVVATAPLEGARKRRATMDIEGAATSQYRRSE